MKMLGKHTVKMLGMHTMMLGKHTVKKMGKHTVKMAPECAEREVLHVSLKGIPAFETLPISAGYISPLLGSVGSGVWGWSVECKV